MKEIPPQQEELTKKGDFTLFKQMSITDKCDAPFFEYNSSALWVSNISPAEGLRQTH